MSYQKRFLKQDCSTGKIAQPETRIFLKKNIVRKINEKILILFNKFFNLNFLYIKNNGIKKLNNSVILFKKINVDIKTVF